MNSPPPKPDAEGERRPAAARCRWTAGAVWLVVLLAVTALGFQIAEWTRWDIGRGGPAWVQASVNSLAHVFVLGTWSLTWLEFWNRGLGGRGSRRFALVVPLMAAVLAEAIQAYLPGHAPDVFGLVCNLGGVGLAVLVYRRRADEFTRPARAVAPTPPGRRAGH